MTGKVGIVGPVLEAGPFAQAVIAAIRLKHSEVSVDDRGAYVRVGVRGRCVLSRAAIESALGRTVALRSELERAMPSFAGRMTLGADEAVWE